MTIHVFYLLLGFTLLAANNQDGEPTFYTQSGLDPAGEEIGTAEIIPICQNARFVSRTQWCDRRTEKWIDANVYK